MGLKREACRHAKRAITLVLLLVALMALANYSTPLPKANASPAIIYSDSQDGMIDSLGVVYSALFIMYVGDAFLNEYLQGFVKFSLLGISGTLSSAILYLCVFESERDNVVYGTSPLPNPGLGDCLVIHIADYVTLDASDLNAPSIGNDPGVLLSSSVTPNIGYVSIDVTAAIQDDINNGRSFSSFMIKMFTNTDADGLADVWFFYTSEETGISEDPYIEYALAPTPRAVGGVLISVNKLDLLAPYLALVGLVGAVSTVFAIRKKRKA